jgi:DNA-binding NarL/FixJ family response regulator
MGNKLVTGLPPILKTRVLLVEGHAPVRRSLARWIDLQKDLVVCGEASNLREGVAAAVHLEPDLAIVDLALGQESGLRLVGLLREKVPGLAILVLSTHEEDLFALPALRAGARGFIMHQDAAKDPLKAIRNVLADKIYLSPNLRRRFWKETWGNRRHPKV